MSNNLKAQSKKHNIGVEKESSLHKTLKFHYAGSPNRLEVPCGSYVCDGISGKGELIEVQIGSFGPIKEKVRSLCEENKLRIIHPIIVNKTISVYDKDNKFIRSRRSPRSGSPWDLFNALIYDPILPSIKNIRIELVLIDLEEVRIMDGRGSWKRKGARIKEKHLTGFHDSIELADLRDYYRFVPFEKEETFTAKSLAERISPRKPSSKTPAGFEVNSSGISLVLARKTLYVLLKLGLIERTGKEKQAWVYKRVHWTA